MEHQYFHQRHQLNGFSFLYLNVLIVAMPFSTVSGVLTRSCDPSLGAMFVARVVTTLSLNL